jgi:NAD(P)-dependent dehydrogenase (short-subunit alcohol dehydrogenase family)
VIAVNVRGTFLGMKFQPERQQQILRPQAMNRFGEPEEVAAAVVWLCSDEASFITGISMPVDAGSIAGW